MKMIYLPVALFLAFVFLPIHPTAIAQSADSIEPITRAHAHNDYEHPRPLLDALDQHFYSVEADIWLVDGQILVSHNKGDWKGALKELYLDPLQERVNQNGSVHGDGKPFLLWLDFKSSSLDMLPILHDLLASYPMLSVFSENKETSKAGTVIVILTGNDQLKQTYTDTYDIRYACRDSNDWNEKDPEGDSKWLWYALPWRSHIRWDGKETLSAEQEQKLRDLVNRIHAKGRKVRFYATPETEAYWSKAVEIGIDLINTDKLKDLHTFLMNQQP